MYGMLIAWSVATAAAHGKACRSGEWRSANSRSVREKDHAQSTFDWCIRTGGIAGVACNAALAHDESKYPDWSGQWTRTYGGNPRYDQSKPLRKQEAPLKPEYQAQFEASIKDQDAGGHGLDTGYTCLPQAHAPDDVGRVAVRISDLAGRHPYAVRADRIFAAPHLHRRTRLAEDRRNLVQRLLDRQMASIRDGDGRFDTLEVETRHVRGPRVWDQSGMPMAADDEGVITERIYSDKSDPGILRVEMTTIDNSLTRPWTVMKTFKRRAKVWWANDNCNEGQAHVTIGTEVYFRSADGTTIMPMKKDQPPPDLRYFKRTQN